MSEWSDAIFMLDEGFTLEQLKQLEPSDAEAWRRLKPFVYKRKKKEKDVGRAVVGEIKYYIWQCVNTHPTQKKKGGAYHRSGCGHYNIRKSKRPLSNNIQQACQSCGRKKRLHPSSIKVIQTANKEDALKKQKELNKGTRWLA